MTTRLAVVLLALALCGCASRGEIEAAYNHGHDVGYSRGEVAGYRAGFVDGMRGKNRAGSLRLTNGVFYSVTGDTFQYRPIEPKIGAAGDSGYAGGLGYRVLEVADDHVTWRVTRWTR